MSFTPCCSGCRPCYPEHDEKDCPGKMTCYRCSTCGDNSCCVKCGDIQCCPTCGDSSVCPETLCDEETNNDTVA